MSDLFHEDVPMDFLEQVFAVMGRAHWHRFQILTKRAERLAELAPGLCWAPNVAYRAPARWADLGSDAGSGVCLIDRAWLALKQGLHLAVLLQAPVIGCRGVCDSAKIHVVGHIGELDATGNGIGGGALGGLEP